MSGDVLIIGEIYIRLASLVRPGISSVATGYNYMVLPSDRLAFMLFSIITGVIVFVAFFAGCIFSPNSGIAKCVFWSRIRRGPYIIELNKL